jgi:FSR family fosmidomycin resistance protein-like MFS transporter
MNRRRLATLTASHLIDDLYQGAVPALVALMVLARGYSYAAATGLTLAATVLSSVAQPAFGLLTDRRPMRWLLPSGLALAGIGIGLSGMSDDYALTWAAIALSGLGVAAYHPEASRAARGAAGGTAVGMSWFALGGNIGFAVGPTATTAVLLAAGLGGTPLLAVPAVAAAAVLAFGRSAPRARSSAPAERVGTSRWRPFLWLTGAVIARSVVFFGASSLIALYLRQRFGADPATASSALTVLLGVGAAATLVGGRLADRLGRVRTIRAGHALAVPALVGLVAAPSLPLAFLATALLGIALYLPFSVQVTLGQDYLPDRVGTASGVTLGLAVSAGGLLAPALGALADHTDLGTALAVLTVAPLAALFVTTRLPEPERVSP